MFRLIIPTLIFLLVCGPQLAFAVETADTLPTGIRGLSMKFGTMAGLNQYYSDSGELKYMSEINSIDLDVDTLSEIDGSVQDLVNVLNQFGPDNLGDQLHLGKMKIEMDPKISYFAPIFLYGQSPKLTVGIGVPIVTYTNSFRATLGGSNIDDLRDQIGGASPELDAAINQLNGDVDTAFRNYVVSQGYNRIEDKNETFIGDAQLIGVYRLDDTPTRRSVLQTYFSLPTGPKPDADDLTDVENFGRWSFRPTYVREQRISARSKLLGVLSYLAVLPANEEYRVPQDANDILPVAAQKDVLTRDVGDTWSATVGFSWEHSASFTSTVAYAYEEKARDRFESSAKGDSSLLEEKTDRRANILKLEFIYSSVSDFLNKKATVPVSVSYELAQVVSGLMFDNRNVENQSRHELWLSLYF